MQFFQETEETLCLRDPNGFLSLTASRQAKEQTEENKNAPAIKRKQARSFKGWMVSVTSEIRANANWQDALGGRRHSDRSDTVSVSHCTPSVYTSFPLYEEVRLLNTSNTHYHNRCYTTAPGVPSGKMPLNTPCNSHHHRRPLSALVLAAV